MNGRSKAGFYAFEVKALPNYGFAVVREQCSVTGEKDSRSWFDRVGTKFTSNVGGMNPSIDSAALSLLLVGGEASFAPVLRTLAAMRVYSIEPSAHRYDRQERGDQREAQPKRSERPDFRHGCGAPSAGDSAVDVTARSPRG